MTVQAAARARGRRRRQRRRDLAAGVRPGETVVDRRRARAEPGQKVRLYVERATAGGNGLRHRTRGHC